MFSLCATTINTIVTTISIIFSIISIVAACRSRKIKQQISKKLDSIDLIEFTSRIDSLIPDFREVIRNPSWNKGVIDNPVVRKLIEQLFTWTKYRMVIKDNGRRDDLDIRINRIVVSKDYSLWDTVFSFSVLNDLYDISKLLNAETYSQRTDMI